MILPHSRYVGPINTGDAFARLVFGLVRTGMAPTSFFDPSFAGPRHYDGLPVDLVARFVAGLAAVGAEGFGIYHVSNSGADDGVSLDRIADWAGEATSPLERLPYDAWFARFRERLATLPEHERNRSPWPILHRWERPATSGGPRLDTTRFASRLEALTGSARVPSLDEAYIRHCVRSIVRAS
jgi:fatty acid CoA ligase FadD9